MTLNDVEVRYAPVLLNSTQDMNGFIEVYKEAFAGFPYFESYSTEDVREVWDEHTTNGRIILAKIGESVVGLGCSIPLHKAPQDVLDFLAERKEAGLLPDDFTPQSACYMSELAVLTEHRRLKVGSQLVRHRLIHVSHDRYKYYVMRTDSENSNSMHLYLSVGATRVPGVHNVSSGDQVTKNGSQSELRMYLYGQSVDALHSLTTRLSEDQEEGPSDEPETSSDTDENKGDEAK